jgi:hypothetical protein
MQACFSAFLSMSCIAVGGGGIPEQTGMSIALTADCQRREATLLPGTLTDQVDRIGLGLKVLVSQDSWQAL